MIEQATVHAYNESERITDWFTMIDENLAVPSWRRRVEHPLGHLTIKVAGTALHRRPESHHVAASAAAPAPGDRHNVQRPILRFEEGARRVELRYIVVD
jgi:reverse gyrase